MVEFCGANGDYLAQQKRRLHTHKYRRLHLNLPGASTGAAFSGEHVLPPLISTKARYKPAHQGHANPTH